MSNEWELVIKGGKHKPKSQLSNKEQKKINQNNLNSNKFRLVLDDETDKSLSPEQDKMLSKPKPKKSNLSKNEDDINKQINKINSESIKKIYSELLERFPNQYTISLLDLAVHLSLMVKSTEDIKTINFDQTEFPYAFLSNDTKTALNSIFGGLSNIHVTNFLKAAMIQLIDDHDKGVQSIGLRILIQSCVRMKSNVFITNRKNFFDLLNVHREQTLKFKLLTWVFKQACSNYNMACQIWLIYFLPFITQKCHTEFVIGFGEEMRDYPTDMSGNDTCLLVADFVPIIDLIFTQNGDVHQHDRKTNKRKQVNFQLTSAQIDRLKLIYPKIKDQAFLSKSPGALKDYFASLFLRLSSIQTRNGSLNKELLNCLDHCVKMSPDVINQLNHLHLEYPQQTRIFLDHLSSENSTATNIKKSKSFKNLMDKIHSTSLAAPAGSVQDNLRILTKTCRSNNDSNSWFSVIVKFFGYLIVMGLLTMGVLCCQFPKQYQLVIDNVAPHVSGVIEFMQPHINCVTQFAKPHVDRMILLATPLCHCCKTHIINAYNNLQPMILNIGQVLQEQSAQLWIVVKPYVTAITIKTDETFRFVQTKLDEMFPRLLEQLADMIHAVMHYCTTLANDIVAYFHSPEFQTMVKLVNDKMTSMLDQVLHVYRYAVSYTMKMVSGN